MSQAVGQIKPLPPFPKEKHWLFGSGYLLKDNTFEHVKFLLNKYGDLISLSLPFIRLAIAANPEYTKHILMDNQRNYTKSLAYDVLKVLLGNGLLTSEGDFWRKQRRLIAPAFHRKKLEILTQLMVERADQVVHKFEKFADSPEAHDMSEEMTALTLDIISRAMFSSGVEDKASMVSEQITLLNQYSIEKINQPIRLPASFPTPFNMKERRAMKLLDEVIYDIINTRRKEGVSKDDLLSMLLDARDEDTGEAMDDKQLRDEVMTIFVAGNETSANALAWTLYLLSQHPEAETKMVAEIEEKLDSGAPLDFQNIMQFNYVRMVIEESMRIYPPAWSIGRRAIEEDTLGNYRIDPGTNVLIPIIYFHHSEKYWTEPKRFIPERFAPEKRGEIDRFVYFPFGGGPRTCIGNSFALVEMQIVLIKLYQHYHFRLKDGFKVQTDPLITLRPKYGMQMHVERRK